MSSIRFNARLDASLHGRPHPFRDAGVVADSLTGIHNVMKCIFFVNRGCIHKGFTRMMSSHVKSRGYKSGERGGHAMGPPSVTIGVTSVTSRTARLKCGRAPSCISAVTHKLNVPGHMLMWAFLLLMWKWCPKCVRYLWVTLCIHRRKLKGTKEPWKNKIIP
jgi:hypothetical protein